MCGLQYSDKTLPCEILLIKCPAAGVFQCSFIQKAFLDALLCTSYSEYAVDKSDDFYLHGAYTVTKEIRINKETTNKKWLH